MSEGYSMNTKDIIAITHEMNCRRVVAVKGVVLSHLAAAQDDNQPAHPAIRLIDRIFNGDYDKVLADDPKDNTVLMDLSARFDREVQ